MIDVCLPLFEKQQKARTCYAAINTHNTTMISDKHCLVNRHIMMMTRHSHLIIPSHYGTRMTRAKNRTKKGCKIHRKWLMYFFLFLGSHSIASDSKRRLCKMERLFRHWTSWWCWMSWVWRRSSQNGRRHSERASWGL